MARYKVMVERPVYEWTEVEVEADSMFDAKMDALTIVTENWDLDWEMGDCGNAYTTSAELVKG